MDNLSDTFIACDKVVLALGGNKAPMLKRLLNVNVPIIGVKGYTFDIVATNNPQDLPVFENFLFLGQHGDYFTLSPLEQGRWRVSSFGDIVEQQHLELDMKRVEQTKASVKHRI